MALFNFFDLSNIMLVLKTVRPNDFIDVFLITYIIYIIAKFFKDTRSMQILWGIAVIVGVLQLSGAFRLNTINFILQNAMQVGFLAIIVLFQSELRSGLSKMGRSRILFFNTEEAKDNSLYREIITSVTSASRYLAEKKIGALIVIEKNIKIDDSIISGTRLDAEVSSELLINIFYPKAPLHDGAVIISDGKIASAGCILPLSQNESLDSELGTRHRAGLGMSEASDAVVIIVSEETGKISLASEGGFSRNLTSNVLEQALKNLLLKDEKITSKSKWKLNIKNAKKKEGGKKND